MSLAEALALGATRAEVRARRELGRWTGIHRGVYAVGHAALGVRGRAIAALLAAGSGAVLSHIAAAITWSMLDDHLFQAHVTVPAGRSRNRSSLHVHGTRDLPGPEIRLRAGLPITSPERTLIDVAETEPAGLTARAVREARVSGLVTEDSLADALERHRARHGASALRSVIAGSEAAPTRSATERALRRLLRDAGLPAPQSNAVVEGYECDLVWHRERLIVEIDVYATHGDRRTFERDRAKDAALTRAGWRVIRVTGDQIEHEPLAVLATIVALLARR